MFENLADKLEKSFKLLKGEGRITEINVAETLKEVRRALLDADVNYKIAKTFTDLVKEKALGQDVLKSVKPGQMLIKIVHDELALLMGGQRVDINIKGSPAVILMAGLQGSGKTTFSAKLANYLTTKKGRTVLLAACDIYRNLGNIETIDQIEAAKYLGTLNYIDASRIGIWGWSFGGYLSALCLEKGAGVFKMAVSVAPVTNWRYYDSIYTERYNGLPQDNASGYDDNSPINFTKKIKGKFLLCHGTADDNVHFQNSMELVSKLVEGNKQFESQFYPDSNHGIYKGRNTRYHLFSRMTTFITENL